MFTRWITIPKFIELMIPPVINCGWLLITPIFHSLTSLAIIIVWCLFRKGYAAQYIVRMKLFIKTCNNYTRRMFCAILLGVSVKGEWSTYTTSGSTHISNNGKYEECSIHQTVHKICISSAYMSLSRMSSMQLIMTVKICHQDNFLVFKLRLTVCDSTRSPNPQIPNSKQIEESVFVPQWKGTSRMN